MINWLMYSTSNSCLPEGFRAALGYVVTNPHHFNLRLLVRDYKLGTANLDK